MDLVIHDLRPEQWEKISSRYADCNVVTDNGSMRPCIGCFGCWNRDPGRCVVKDGYDNMGYLIHHAGEVTVISRYTYGGFSGSVKNVFDRCLPYVLPQFEIVGGETHHKKRYDEDKPFTFIFYGHALTEEEKGSARRYARAVCTNIRGWVKDVRFEECPEESALTEQHAQDAAGRIEDPDLAGKVVLLNGSMRSENGNSAKLARMLKSQLRADSVIVDLRKYLNDMTGLIRALEDAAAIVLCVPLYVDGLPSQVIRLMERCEREYKGGPKRIYLLTNMGLYESGQLVNLFSAVRQWCGKMGFMYCGGLGVSAGELLGALMEVLPFRSGPTRDTAIGMERLAEAVNGKTGLGDVFAEPYRFPRSLYVFIANTNWNRTAKKNGISPKDLYRRL
ncbi:MAG: NAD(P)H-dependent oxidoreductase [Mogibacterium sp.]|nr:NAD(P)H-dependent oxidoreductase [Mogibacterium sp.]